MPAAELLERRLGQVPDGIAYLGIGAGHRRQRAARRSAPRSASLGDRLDDGGHRPGGHRQRRRRRGLRERGPAARGRLRPGRGDHADGLGRHRARRHGRAGRCCTTTRDAAFGWRLDHDKVLDAFDQAWDERAGAVVLVEASDLSRVAAYGPRATARPAPRAAATEALADADALLGDAARADRPRATTRCSCCRPCRPPSAPALGVVALRAPGRRRRPAPVGRPPAATATSSSRTWRPTVLDPAGRGAPDDMEGRASRWATARGGDRTGRAGRCGRRRRLPRRDRAAGGHAASRSALAVLARGDGAARPAVARGPAGCWRPLAYGALGLVPATLPGRPGRWPCGPTWSAQAGRSWWRSPRLVAVVADRAERAAPGGRRPRGRGCDRGG